MIWQANIRFKQEVTPPPPVRVRNVPSLNVAIDCCENQRSPSLFLRIYRLCSRGARPFVPPLPTPRGFLRCCRDHGGTQDGRSAGGTSSMKAGQSTGMRRASLPVTPGVASLGGGGGVCPEPDLSHLTDEERKIIEEVMARAKAEEEKEQAMIRFDWLGVGIETGFCSSADVIYFIRGRAAAMLEIPALAMAAFDREKPPPGGPKMASGFPHQYLAARKRY
ncbi:Regulating synaptic membrane exocytosis protein 2 [Branchiostoma belcheri]|nr:Regulating synaptic membrane exocytosis protein 2 [Branchiostoma belcheri]